jgi:predicted amidohydrolase
VVFPELSLTGYELEAPAVDPEESALLPIIKACAETASVAFVGAPIEQDEQRYIATLMIDGAGVDVVYTKSHLSGDELRNHTAGPGPTALGLDGWRVGLGICKDTGVAAHTEGTAALDVDVYVAGVVHAPEELDEQDARGLRIASACDAYVAFASAAGPAGGGYDATAGESTIWSPTGETLARATAAVGDVVHAVLQPR